MFDYPSNVPILIPPTNMDLLMTNAKNAMGVGRHQAVHGLNMGDSQDLWSENSGNGTIAGAP